MLVALGIRTFSLVMTMEYYFGGSNEKKIKSELSKRGDSERF